MSGTTAVPRERQHLGAHVPPPREAGGRRSGSRCPRRSGGTGWSGTARSPRARLTPVPQPPFRTRPSWWRPRRAIIAHSTVVPPGGLRRVRSDSTQRPDGVPTASHGQLPAGHLSRTRPEPSARAPPGAAGRRPPRCTSPSPVAGPAMCGPPGTLPLRAPPGRGCSGRRRRPSEHPLRLRSAQNAEWCLAAEGLLVQRTLPRDDQACTGEDVLETDDVEDDVHAGPYPGPQGTEDREAHAACGSRSRLLRAGTDAGLRQDSGPPLQIQVQRADLLGRRALLGAEDGRGAPWSPQRVVDVGGDDDLGLGDSGVATQVGRGDGAGVRQSGAEDVAGLVVEATPERLQHPRPAVSRRAAAESQHDRLGAGL